MHRTRIPRQDNRQSLVINQGITIVLVVLSLVLWVAANAATIPDFVAACQSFSNLKEPICECMGEKARKRLTPNAFDFVVASMEKNNAETSRLRAELSFGELMTTGTFMANGPSECAGGGAGHSH